MNVPPWIIVFGTVAHWVIYAVGAALAAGERRGSEGPQRGDEEQGIVSGRRACRLYCRVGIGFHLQIHPDGRVNGSHEANHLSVLELFAVSQGVIGVKGVYSNRFLAMNKRGRLHATEWFTDDCKFRERFQENSYNTYASVLHMNHRTGRQWFVALNKRGKAKMGSSPRVKSQHVSTHFLPRVDLHYQSLQRGFTVADGTTGTKDRRKNPAPPPPPAPAPKPTTAARPATSRVNVQERTVPRRAEFKYWPKYRFG